MIWKRYKTATSSGRSIGGVTYESRVRVIPLLRRCWPRKTRYRIALGLMVLVIAGLLGPFVFSRVMSPTRALQFESFESVSAPTRDVSDDSAVRLVCYNIAHGRGLADSNWDGGSKQIREDRLNDIASLLREIDADVVVLNEVDFDASWSHSIDQAAYLAEQAGYAHAVTLRNLDFQVGVWRWRFGNAVLSRYPILHAQEIDLPGYAKWETVLAGKKRALFCEIDLGGRTLGVVATHLSHRSEDLRVASAKRLLDFVERYEKPVVIAGDLNASPTRFAGTAKSSSGLSAIDVIDRSGLYRRWPEDGSEDPSVYTFRSDRPARVIDWILVPVQHERRDDRVIHSLLSDHRPVVTDIRLEGTRG